MSIESISANTGSEANGTTAERQFDELLRLTNLVNRAGAGVLSSFALTLDAADQRTQVIREDGKVYTYGYDAIGQLTNASATLPDGTPWSGYQFSYAYDATGNPVEQNKNGLVYSNSFNNLNQNVDSAPGGSLTVLGAVNYPGGTATVNNVQAQMAPDGTFAASGVPFALGSNTLNWAFTDAFGRSTNRASSVTVSPKTFGYDLNGNMTNDSRFVYAWNCENRLVSVRDVSTGALVQSNRYDALWRRREKIEYAPDGTAVTNRYIYKDWLVLAITDGSGNTLETYTHGADLSGQVGGKAGGVGGILTSTQSGTAVIYHSDFNGNIVNVASINQRLQASYAYSVFGEVLHNEGTFSSRYQFSSKEYDAASELNYYGYRFYRATQGVWLSRDPRKELGFMVVREFKSLMAFRLLREFMAEYIESLAVRARSIGVDESMVYILEQLAVRLKTVTYEQFIALSANQYMFVLNNPITLFDVLGLTEGYLEDQPWPPNEPDEMREGDWSDVLKAVQMLGDQYFKEEIDASQRKIKGWMKQHKISTGCIVVAGAACAWTAEYEIRHKVTIPKLSTSSGDHLTYSVKGCMSFKDDKKTEIMFAISFHW